MLTATLGGLIKDYRIKKRLSQLEVSLRIGWKDTSRLSKIEQGRVGKPTRPTVDKIIKALELTNQEAGEFLEEGGYLPTDEEIKRVISKVKDRIDSWPCACYLIDFSWRFLYANKNTSKLYQFPDQFRKDIPSLKISLLQFAVEPDKNMTVKIWKGDDPESLHPFDAAQILQFKIEQHSREADRWYRNLVASLVKNDAFRKLWNNVVPQNYHKKMLDYEYKRVILTDEHKEEWTIDLHVTTAQFIDDSRFSLVMYFPANQQATDFFTNS
ncbi:helix-turn-helix domain-containing protein [Patescibacteria group bacterium]|nr:helix-turn-helix domain-containing protein [Patescibacteria group bacterium]MCL5409896.1 helix-turn-helix domain-containing protein [Patescibacteria group bacterium]